MPRSAIKPVLSELSEPCTLCASTAMALPIRISGARNRSVLALMVAFGQVVGSIGFVPVRADSAESNSTPYPCKDHPCGCRTAAQCWSAACCCFTMREKVTWAFARGMTPPERAIRMAAIEPLPDRNTSAKSCCDKGHAAKPGATPVDCVIATSDDSHRLPENPNIPARSASDRDDWTISLFAQHCRGEETGTLVLLTIGIAPSPPQSFEMDVACVDWCITGNHVPIPIPFAPAPPPPRSC